MPRGKARPIIERAKASNVPSPIAEKIREGLAPYLLGMLKTIGQAGAGPKLRGRGNITAAINGVRLLVDTVGKGSGEQAIVNLIKEMQGNQSEEIEEWNEEEFIDAEEDTEFEELNQEIDEEFVD